MGWGGVRWGGVRWGEVGWRWGEVEVGPRAACSASLCMEVVWVH